ACPSPGRDGARSGTLTSMGDAASGMGDLAGDFRAAYSPYVVPALSGPDPGFARGLCCKSLFLPGIHETSRRIPDLLPAPTGLGRDAARFIFGAQRGPLV